MTSSRTRPLSQSTPAIDDPLPGRATQATFERGAALAYATVALESVRNLKQLHEGLRWISNREALDDAIRTLELLHGDILRAQGSRS